MEGIVGIAGTPGTGKKSVAPLVAVELGLSCHGLNELAHSLGVTASPTGSVDTDMFRKKLKTISGPAVLYGHLLPYSLEGTWVSRVAVLRCEPAILKRRLEKRGYPKRQIVENVEAELIGLESSDCYELFGLAKTFEVDTTRLTASESAAKVVAVLNGRAPGRRLDWLRAYDSGAKLRSLLSVSES